MKRGRAKAAAAAPAIQRLHPIALHTTSASKDSESKSAFSSGSHSALLSAKDVSVTGATINAICVCALMAVQVCVSVKKQKDIRDWLEARKCEGSKPTKRILVLSGPSGERLESLYV